MDSPANTKPANRRRHQRAPFNSWADVQWDADGRMGFARARILDVSESGVRLSLSGGSLRVGVPVRVRIEQFGFSEYGTVRHVWGNGTLGVEWRFDATTKMELERWKKCVQSAQST